MPDKPEYQPIFHVGNKHSADCGTPPHIDGNIRKRYHGYFENEFGEQAIFIYDYEVKVVQYGKTWRSRGFCPAKGRSDRTWKEKIRYPVKR